MTVLRMGLIVLGKHYLDHNHHNHHNDDDQDH